MTTSPSTRRILAYSRTNTSPTSTISKTHSPQVLAEVTDRSLLNWERNFLPIFRWKIHFYDQFQPRLNRVQWSPKGKSVDEVSGRENRSNERERENIDLAITPSTSTEFLGRPAWVNERLRLIWDFYPTPEKFEPVSDEKWIDRAEFQRI